MGLQEILSQIDREIVQLKQARAMLEGTRTSPTSNPKPKKRNLTPEGRRRIAEAVKRRWALEKKTKLVESADRVRESLPGKLAYQASQLQLPA